ncbi:MULTISPECIES: hypothetical protein [Sphingomonas]|uniref:hypothetical protein n=1 Tax=Sphingomonas TaxID=13687 RepID=UPI00083286B7|nr:hypothetical protein [Sphingomonas sp. CCH10-B3]
MTMREPNEDWWKAVMREADEGIAPLQLTDRRILKAAANSAPPSRSSRWLPSAIAASIALVAIGFAFGPYRGGDQPGGEVIAADGGVQPNIPNTPTGVRVELAFDADSAALTPRIETALDAVAAQVDLCAKGTTVRLVSGGEAALRTARARTIFHALDPVVGDRCRPVIEPVAATREQSPVLEIASGGAPRR